MHVNVNIDNFKFIHFREFAKIDNFAQVIFTFLKLLSI